MKHYNYLTRLVPIVALAYACHTEPVKKPIKDEVTMDVSNMVVSSLLNHDSELRFNDIDMDGKIDGLIYTHYGGSDVYVMAYDSSKYNAYKQLFGWKVDKALKLTPVLDSAMLNFIEAAKEFRWKYEIERYKQQKSPR